MSFEVILCFFFWEGWQFSGYLMKHRNLSLNLVLKWDVRKMMVKTILSKL